MTNKKMFLQMGVGEGENYRRYVSSDNFKNFVVRVKETDLFIKSKIELNKEAMDAAKKYRNQIERYIDLFPRFKSTFSPWELRGSAPKIIEDMVKASKVAKVGPMASIAGAISEYVGKELLKYTKDIMLENGGDIFLQSSSDFTIGIFAGNSPFSLKIGIKVNSRGKPMGICTSSGTVGHSFSFGRADAVTVIAKSALLADAAATVMGNIILSKDDIDKGLQFARKMEGISGSLIILGDALGTWGDVELVDIDPANH